MSDPYRDPYTPTRARTFWIYSKVAVAISISFCLITFSVLQTMKHFDHKPCTDSVVLQNSTVTEDCHKDATVSTEVILGRVLVTCRCKH